MSVPVPLLYLPELAAHAEATRAAIEALGVVEVATEGGRDAQGGGVPPLSPILPEHMARPYYSDADRRTTERATLPSLGRVVWVAGRSRGRSAVPVATGFFLVAETLEQARRIVERLQGEGYAAELYQAGEAARPFEAVSTPSAGLLIRLLPGHLGPELGRLQAAEARARRLARTRESLQVAIETVGEAESTEEAELLATRVVRTHNLTAAGVQGLLTHAERGVRVAAVRALPGLRQAVAAQTASVAEDWRAPLVASLRGAPADLRDELARLEWTRTAPYAREALQLVMGQTAAGAQGRHLLEVVRTHLARGTAPTALAGLGEAAARCAQDVPEQLRPDVLFAPGSAGALVSRLAGVSPYTAYTEQLLDAANRVIQEQIAEGAPVDLGGALALVLQRGYQGVSLTMLGLVAHSRLHWRGGGATMADVVLGGARALRELAAQYTAEEAARTTTADPAGRSAGPKGPPARGRGTP